MFDLELTERLDRVQGMPTKTLGKGDKIELNPNTIYMCLVPHKRGESGNIAPQITRG